MNDSTHMNITVAMSLRWPSQVADFLQIEPVTLLWFLQCLADLRQSRSRASEAEVVAVEAAAVVARNWQALKVMSDSQGKGAAAEGRNRTDSGLTSFVGSSAPPLLQRGTRA